MANSPVNESPKELPASSWTWAMRGLVLLGLAFVFFRASNAPIHPLDTWSHWKYGEWIWQHGRLPEREPFSIYSDHRLPLIDSWWLSQVVCYRIYDLWGMEGIALLYGLAELAKIALFLAAFRRLTGSLGWGLVGVVILYAGRWTYFGVFRPQVMAEVCWAGLLCGCARPPLSRWAVVWIPVCVMLWANLHGAFLLAFVLLGSILAGRFVDRVLAERSLGNAQCDADVRRLAFTLVLSGAAACLNPYGPRLLWEMAHFGQQPILQTVREWQPMTPMTTYGSKVLVLSLFLTFITIRLSPRHFTPSETILLGAFALAAWFAARMFPWWLSILPYVLLPHWQAITKVYVVPQPAAPARAALTRAMGWETIHPRVAVSLFGCGATAAVGLMLLSGSGRWLLSQQPRPIAEQVSADTPVRLVGALKAWLARPDGPVAMPLRIFHPVLWSDYLLWELPPSASIYWYTHWHAYKVERSNDGKYLTELEPPPNDWRKIVDTCRFNVLLLQREDPPSPLFDHLLRQDCRPDAAWRIVYKDYSEGAQQTGQPVGIIAVRHLDPLVLGLANATAVQGCAGAVGPIPLAGSWAFLTHLPWSWAK